MKQHDWSKPYHGVSHLGEFSTQKRWCTITVWGDALTELFLWFPGCGFSPHKSTHSTEQEAKSKAEKWMNEIA